MKINFKKLDTHLSWKQEKCDAIKAYNKGHKTKYKHFTEMIYDLFCKNKKIEYIAEIFKMTNPSIRYHLKKMNCKLDHGGPRGVKSVTGLPGVYPLKTPGRYTVWFYKKREKTYITTCNSLFMAVIERRAAEIRGGFKYRSLAQEYINRNWLNSESYKEAEQPKIGRPYNSLSSVSDTEKHNKRSIIQ